MKKYRKTMRKNITDNKEKFCKMMNNMKMENFKMMNDINTESKFCQQ